jgi:hypothetical protein
MNTAGRENHSSRPVVVAVKFKPTEVAVMIVRIRPKEEQKRASVYTQALERWRSAERLVSERWRSFLTAERESKPGAFAAYEMALRAEESAADELALVQVGEAA